MDDHILKSKKKIIRKSEKNRSSATIGSQRYCIIMRQQGKTGRMWPKVFRSKLAPETPAPHSDLNALTLSDSSIADSKACKQLGSLSDFSSIANENIYNKVDHIIRPSAIRPSKQTQACASKATPLKSLNKEKTTNKHKKRNSGSNKENQLTPSLHNAVAIIPTDGSEPLSDRTRPFLSERTTIIKKELPSSSDTRIHKSNNNASRTSKSTSTGTESTTDICTNVKSHCESPNKAQSREPRPRYQLTTSSNVLQLSSNVYQIRGLKVTFVDDAYKIFAIDLLDAATCDRINRLTDHYVEHVKSIGREELSWRTLYTYTKMDIPCCDVPGMNILMASILSNVNIVIGDVFGCPKAAKNLRPRSWKEPHLLKYEFDEEHTGVEMHYDGSHFTFNLMLSDPSEYSGGGTYFRCLQKTIKLCKGQVLVHPGDLYHKGVDIASGTRRLVVCFLDGFRPNIKDKSTDEVDHSEYEKHVIQL